MSVRKVVFSAVAAGLVLLLVEGLLNTAGAVRGGLTAQRNTEEAHTAHDAELGWSNLKNFHRPHLYGADRGYTTNSQGLRGLEGDYSQAVPSGRYRIVALGDSFTMGHGVDDADTYPAQLQALTPGAQVINMGMGGYGVGQAYLAYERDGKSFDADLLVFAVIEGDFQRMLQRDFMGYAKPWVLEHNGTLVTDNVPVPSSFSRRNLQHGTRVFLRQLALGRLAMRLVDWVLPSSQVDGMSAEIEGFESTASLIFTTLQKHCQATGQDFVIVYLPTDYGLRRDVGPVLLWLHRFSRQHDIHFLDMSRAFERRSPRELSRLFRPDGHYSAAGNRFVAEQLKQDLSARLPTFGGTAAAPEAAPPEAAPAVAAPTEAAPAAAPPTQPHD